LTRCYQPCCHILSLYISIAPSKDQKLAARLGAGSEFLQKLHRKHTDWETGAVRKGYHYPNGTTSGKEFVHFALTNKLDQLEEAKTLATAAFESYSKSKLKKNRETFTSTYIAELLMSMHSDTLRNVVKDRFGQTLPALKPHWKRNIVHKSIEMGKTLGEIDFGTLERPKMSTAKAFKRQRTGRGADSADQNRVLFFEGK